MDNLDITITDPQGNQFNGNDFVRPPFDDQAGSLNNVERVSIQQPVPGMYLFTATGQNVPYPDQSYALVVSYEKRPEGTHSHGKKRGQGLACT